MPGRELLDSAVMCEWVKLATCRLVSVSSELATMETRVSGGLVRKSTAHAIIRSSGWFLRFRKICTAMRCTWREREMTRNCLSNCPGLVIESTGQKQPESQL